MRKLFNLIDNPLFSGSVIMIIGSTIANAINYLYHLIVGRLLGPSSYGELVSLISLSGLLSVLPASISLVIVKYVSASRDIRDQTALISWLKIRAFQLSVIFFVLVVLITPVIGSFLHISNLSYILIVGFTFIFSLPAFYNRSILQGLLKFKEATVSILFENSTRFAVSVLLIFLGFKVSGAIWGLAVSAAVGWYIADIYLKTYNSKNPKVSSNIKSVILYSIPVVIQSIALMSLYSTDLILVKHFFSAYDAGIYAALSTLGKIIIFGTGPIGAVMFPLVSQRKSKGQGYKKIFIYSLLLTLAFTSFVLIIYWLFPQFTINLLYGGAYLEAAPFLIWFGLFITLFTISSLIINFHLSLGHIRVVFLPAVAAFTQIIAIWFFHKNLFSVIVVSILVASLLLGFLLIYSSYEKTQSGDQFDISDSPRI